MATIISQINIVNVNTDIWQLVSQSSPSIETSNMGGSSGELSEELMTQEKRKKSCKMNCDVGEATEVLDNDL